MADKEICGIEVDIDLSSNPKVYYMFDRPEVDREIQAFFKENGLKVMSTSAIGGNSPTHIQLFGPARGVLKFVEEYLGDDPPSGVYTLLYRDT